MLKDILNAGEASHAVAMIALGGSCGTLHDIANARTTGSCEWDVVAWALLSCDGINGVGALTVADEIDRYLASGEQIPDAARTRLIELKGLIGQTARDLSPGRTPSPAKTSPVKMVDRRGVAL